MKRRPLIFAAAALLATFAFLASRTLLAQASPAQRQLNLDSFEKVWTTIRDKHWQKEPGGLDWQAIHGEFRPRIEEAANTDEVRAILRDMLGRLHQTHFNVLPGNVYAAVGQDIPGEAQAGIDLRVLDGQAIVTRVNPGSSAESQGVKLGWKIVSASSQDFDALIKQALSDPSVHELTLTRALLARLSGNTGGRVHGTFLDGAGKMVELDLALAAPRGQAAVFGNLPTQHVWVESRMITDRGGKVGYMGFNMFLDLVRVMGDFQTTVQNCAACRGLIIDLRGNPGGIGGMAMGMAGFLVDQPGLRLGVMQTREVSLNFVINPRPVVFKGPVAILLDACSASTAEIFAGGLKDLGRAHVFGTRSAAAALPSVIERLPNGDGFQYAVANYISAGGKALEGNGVEPDTEVKLTRPALLGGHDLVLDAALDWIKSAPATASAQRDFRAAASASQLAPALVPMPVERSTP
jgi:carboxyl-terminal processing protease